ncbi:basic proline-rich protein-like [Antechinus flavipes]|uniref:basic proline-rich protein-like n=1 Tax=Antechinus flavipes TaxID=38775 RepID=UPI002235B3C6|nr:basic proline-rich protein-like [Antechinus flavipes]
MARRSAPPLFSPPPGTAEGAPPPSPGRVHAHTRPKHEGSEDTPRPLAPEPPLSLHAPPHPILAASRCPSRIRSPISKSPPPPRRRLGTRLQTSVVSVQNTRARRRRRRRRVSESPNTAPPSPHPRPAPPLLPRQARLYVCGARAPAQTPSSLAPSPGRRCLLLLLFLPPDAPPPPAPGLGSPSLLFQCRESQWGRRHSRGSQRRALVTTSQPPPPQPPGAPDTFPSHPAPFPQPPPPPAPFSGACPIVRPRIAPAPAKPPPPRGASRPLAAARTPGGEPARLPPPRGPRTRSRRAATASPEGGRCWGSAAASDGAVPGLPSLPPPPPARPPPPPPGWGRGSQPASFLYLSPTPSSPSEADCIKGGGEDQKEK